MRNKLYPVLLAAVLLLAVLTGARRLLILAGFLLALWGSMAGLARRFAGAVKASLTLARSGEDHALQARITLENTSRLPIPAVRAEVKCRDSGTGQTWCWSGAAALMEREKATLCFAFRAGDDCCVWLESLRVSDPLGLFSFRALETEDLKRVKTLTDAVSVPTERASGENGDLRPFRPGDPLKSVHWKLSAKLDTLLVRGTAADRDSVPTVSPDREEKKQSEAPDGPAELLRRELLPGKRCGSSWISDFLAAWARLAMPLAGIAQLLVTGFSLNVSGGLLWGGLALLSLLFTAFFYEDWLTGARGPGGAALTLTFLVAVLFLQERYLAGFRQLGSAVLQRLNEIYHGDYMLPQAAGGPVDGALFLLLSAVPLAAWLGAFCVRRTDGLLAGLVLFPLTALALLLGARPRADSLSCLLLGLVSLGMTEKTTGAARLWGRKNDSRECRSRRRWVRSFWTAAGALIGGLCLLLGLILMPLLELPAARVKPLTNELRERTAKAVLEKLPDGLGGRLTAADTASGGGVEDGSLTDGTGFLLDGVEDLLLHCTVKPEETVYLRGFVGGSYAGNRWLPPSAETFDAAAEGWNTEGDPGLYISNLPFLRMLYAENQADAQWEQAELTVERLNANGGFTYVPYCGYLNAYYTVSGDGAVAGQSTQDDSFPFYFQSAYTEQLREKFFLRDESSLDRLERSYSAYVRERYTEIPGMLEEDARIWVQDAPDTEDTQTLIAFVQDFLRERCSYRLEAAAFPPERDAIEYFLNESRQGYSPQFASAATVLFRALGIPARYVVGYAVSESLFTAQPGGCFDALVRSENAHAWTEIYVSGTGWIPVETTPGQLGLVREAEYYGTDRQSAEAPSQTEPEQGQPEAEAKNFHPAWLLLLLIPAAAWLLWHSRGNRGASNKADAPEAQRFRRAFAGYYRCLVRAGMPERTTSADPEFALWAYRLDPALSGQELEKMLGLAMKSTFGREKVTESEAAWMERQLARGKKTIRRIKNTEKTE